jgi:hypothetical protein
MTESDWLSCYYDEDVRQWLQLSRITSPRKIRLFCCGLVRRDIAWLRPPWGQRALETAERFADGKASRSELAAAQKSALKQIMGGALPETTEEERNISRATKAATGAAIPDAWLAAATFVMLPEYRAGEELYLRDVVGNPFRKVKIDPAWSSQTVLAIARGIYEERSFSQIAVLADALEEAGCADAAILEHCRNAGPHIRGCWVVDLLLGKK